jgi:predicted small secreted protein
MKTFRLILLAIVTLSAGLLTSCNTTAGAGRDIQQAGEGIHDTARKVQNGY